MPRLTLAERARMARTRAGFAREIDAANAIGCSRPLVIRWETDAKSIGQKYLLPAARAYKVRPEWLAMESDDDGFPWGEDAEKATPTVELSPGIVSDLAWNLQDAFEEELGRPYSLVDEPELFVGAYQIAASGKAQDMRRAMLWLGKQLKDLAEQGPSKNVRREAAMDESNTPGRYGKASQKR